VTLRLSPEPPSRKIYPAAHRVTRYTAIEELLFAVYRLLFVRPRHHTVPSINIWNHSCSDNLFVCDNVHTDYVSAVVAVCIYCALQIVMFTLHYITYLYLLIPFRQWCADAKCSFDSLWPHASSAHAPPWGYDVCCEIVNTRRWQHIPMFDVWMFSRNMCQTGDCVSYCWSAIH